MVFIPAEVLWNSRLIYGRQSPLRAWAGSHAAKREKQPDCNTCRKSSDAGFDQLRLSRPLARGTDLDWAGGFVFSEGFLSHWQVWIGAAVAMQYGSWRLARYARRAGQATDEGNVAKGIRDERTGHRKCISSGRASAILRIDSGGFSMRYDTRYRSRSSLFNWSFPTGVKWLIISNLAVYIIYFFGSLMSGEPIFGSLELVPAAVIRGAVWQLFTYLFLHSLTSLWHILFNMLALWMFGAPIEQTWGTRRFLQYYFICGIGAGICVVLANLAFGDPYQRTHRGVGRHLRPAARLRDAVPESDGPDEFSVPDQSQVHGDDLRRDRVSELVPERAAR